MDMFCSRSERYKKPFGAVKSGTSVRFCVHAPEESSIELCIIEDGRDAPSLFAMRKNEDSGDFVLEHVFEKEGLYFYWFSLQGSRVLTRSRGGNATFDPEGCWFQQTVYAASYEPPVGFAGTVMYQIFPDRFNIASKVRQTRFAARKIYKYTDEPLNFRPNAQGKILNDDYYGGNLEGIENKLGYLHSLGVRCIYINPICEAHSNHRYNTADYMRVDPLLGDDGDFSRLCARAHERGIKIVLDGVFSHTGDDSVYFNKYGTYEDLGAYQSTDSEYYTWYKFRNWPDDYTAWWGFETLPELNEETPSYRDFICGKGGVIEHWMNLGADGFRLDVADELPDVFIERIRAAVKRFGNDKILIGEVWEDASNKISYGERRRFLWGRELDSSMNYPYRTVVIEFLQTADAGLFRERVEMIAENYPKPMLDVMMNILGTHDTERLITALGISESYAGRDREWLAARYLTTDEYLRGVELAKLAFALQFFLPGVPCIYYGDELGMQGFRDPFCRRFMEWNSADENLRSQLKKISKLREQNRDVLENGSISFVRSDDETVAFVRENEKGAVLCAVNRSQHKALISTHHRRFSLPPWRYIIERLR